MQKQYKVRFEKLIEILSDVDRGYVTIEGEKMKLDFSVWKYKEDNRVTRASACGMAMSHPWFQKQGFVSSLKHHPNAVGPDYPIYINPRNRRMTAESFDAVCAFFGITSDEAKHLFTWDAYDERTRTAKMLIARIQAFLEENKRRSRLHLPA